MKRLPQNQIELIYMLAVTLITSLTTLGIVFMIANKVDTELYAVGGSGAAAMIGQLVAKRLQG